MTVDITVKDSAKGSNPRSILIGFFENRVLDYNPFIAKNFRDSLNYEFFTRGYGVQLADFTEAGKESAPPQLLQENRIPEFMQKNSADVFIQGSIFEARYGDAIEDQTSTSITLNIYNKNGERVGTARCITSKTLTSAENLRSIAGTLVSSVHSKLSH
jgi:hypothetical protein